MGYIPVKGIKKYMNNISYQLSYSITNKILDKI